MRRRRGGVWAAVVLVLPLLAGCGRSATSWGSSASDGAVDPPGAGADAGPAEGTAGHGDDAADAGRTDAGRTDAGPDGTGRDGALDLGRFDDDSPRYEGGVADLEGGLGDPLGGGFGGSGGTSTDAGATVDAGLPDAGWPPAAARPGWCGGGAPTAEIQMSRDRIMVLAADGRLYEWSLRDGISDRWVLDEAVGLSLPEYISPLRLDAEGRLWRLAPAAGPLMPDHRWVALFKSIHGGLLLADDGGLYFSGLFYDPLYGIADEQQPDDPSWLRGEVPLEPDRAYVQASGGICHFAAVSEGGRLLTWGCNYYGQLVRNGTETDWTPAPVDDSRDWEAVWLGPASGWARRRNGEIWSLRAVGPGLTRYAGASAGWRKIANGGGGDVGLKEDGSLWTRGSNRYFALGRPELPQTAYAHDFEPISDDARWLDFAPEGWSVAAVREDGSVWVWGTLERLRATPFRVPLRIGEVPVRLPPLPPVADTVEAEVLPALSALFDEAPAGHPGRLFLDSARVLLAGTATGTYESAPDLLRACDLKAALEQLRNATAALQAASKLGLETGDLEVAVAAQAVRAARETARAAGSTDPAVLLRLASAEAVLLDDPVRAATLAAQTARYLVDGG